MRGNILPPPHSEAFLEILIAMGARLMSDAHDHVQTARNT
jgi:hypothetical protein